MAKVATVKQVEAMIAEEIKKETGGSVVITVLPANASGQEKISALAESAADIAKAHQVLRLLGECVEKAIYPEDNEYCFFYVTNG
jgi:hypothetical protein